jgi:hypothetical protein
MTMRTTIDLDEELLARAKEKAARQKTTLSGLVTEAVQAYLLVPTDAPDARRFVLVTAGRPGGTYPSPEAVAALLDEEDMPRAR